jgi:ABC-type glycerol-3-phosphate transport system substrate-binding protein
MVGGLVKQDVRSVESASGVYGSIIDKNAEQTELALDFLRFWFSKPGYQAFVDGGVNSTRGYNVSGPIMVNDIVLPEKLQNMVGSIKMMGNAENGRYYPWDFGGVDDLDKQARDLYKQALEGNITPQDFTTALQKLWDDNWDKILPKAGLTEENLKNPALQPGS